MQDKNLFEMLPNPLGFITLLTIVIVFPRRLYMEEYISLDIGGFFQVVKGLLKTWSYKFC